MQGLDVQGVDHVWGSHKPSYLQLPYPTKGCEHNTGHFRSQFFLYIFDLAFEAHVEVVR